MAFDFDLLTRWLAALEGGTYKQAKWQLRDGDGFCCLGVACDLYDPSKWRDGGWRDGYWWDEGWGDGEGKVLTPDVASALGLRFFNGRFGVPGEGMWMYCLSERNDEGATFAEIAALIRSRPPGLFTPEAEAVLADKWGPK